MKNLPALKFYLLVIIGLCFVSCENSNEKQNLSIKSPVISCESLSDKVSEAQKEWIEAKKQEAEMKQIIRNSKTLLETERDSLGIKSLDVSIDVAQKAIKRIGEAKKSYDKSIVELKKYCSKE